MLCLTRKTGESVVVKTIDGDVWFTISRIDGNQVRVGIEAPDHYRILRGEINATQSQDSATTADCQESQGRTSTDADFAGSAGHGGR